MSIKYSLIIYSRIRIALFFSIVFPILLLVVFGSIWGITDPDYLFFLVSGITGMNLLSQGLYSTGAIIKQYYQQHTIKFLKSLPVNILSYFTGLILCRAIVVFVSIASLILVVFLFFGHTFRGNEILLLFVGSFFGIAMFSFMGLLISFFGSFKPDKDSSKEIGNLVYFLMIFLCDTFFPISQLNPIMGTISKLFPLTYLLSFFRNEAIFQSIVAMVIFTAVFAGLFLIMYKKREVQRI
ncbi:ABC transporter permease [Maribacter sp. IgM3_T14_3]|uniref:ABC transporter permease n=1 Tax=Maribacter sp. IgM3_T14_3 TaxID=3415140 RepID=UPI003C6F8214